MAAPQGGTVPATPRPYEPKKKGRGVAAAPCLIGSKFEEERLFLAEGLLQRHAPHPRFGGDAGDDAAEV